MQVNGHPVSGEQVMGFFDDQLSPAETKAVAQHLAECWECQVLLADLKEVSGALQSWTIDEPQRELQVPSVPRKRASWVEWKPWATAATIVLILGGLLVSRRSAVKEEERFRVVESAKKEAFLPQEKSRPSSPSGAMLFETREGRAQRDSQSMPPAPALDSPLQPNQEPTAPMVVRTADLAITAARFDPARGDIERIAKFRGGFVADLAVTSATGQPRSLRATLRVPAAQLEGVLNDLRQLGHVDSEAQRGEDVTRQYVDVTARVANLREAERRLTTILRERTGKLSDVLAVEEQIDNTRGQIEVAEAEQKSLANQVSLATVQVTVAEVYHARLNGDNIGVATRLRNAAVNGLRLVGTSLLGLLLWILTYAPVLLVAALFLFWPLRLAWKRMRT